MSPKIPRSRTGVAQWPDGRNIQWILYVSGQCFVGTTAGERKLAGYPKRIDWNESDDRITQLVNEHLLARPGAQMCSNPRP